MLPTWRRALALVQPDMLLRWHREWFRMFWRQRSRSANLERRVAVETITLIREMATKNRIGKWPEVERIIAEFPALLRRSRFVPLAISIDHARQAGSLAGAHRDPFDRMLIAQSREEKATLISGDTVFAAYGVETIWA